MTELITLSYDGTFAMIDYVIARNALLRVIFFTADIFRHSAAQSPAARLPRDIWRRFLWFSSQLLYQGHFPFQILSSLPSGIITSWIFDAPVAAARDGGVEPERDMRQVASALCYTGQTRVQTCKMTADIFLYRVFLSLKNISRNVSQAFAAACPTSSVSDFLAIRWLRDDPRYIPLFL